MKQLLCALVVALAIPSATPTIAEEDETEKARVAVAITKAEAALEDAETSDELLLALTNGIDAYEGALGLHMRAMARLAEKSNRIRSVLTEQSLETALDVAMLQNLARAPETALQAHIANPLDAARAAMLMTAVGPALDARAKVLRDRLSVLDEIRAEQDRIRAEGQSALARYQHLRANAIRTLRERQPASAPALDALKAQARDAAAGGRGLGGVAAQLGQRPVLTTTSAGRASFLDARGKLRWPVHGKVIKGLPDAPGGGENGMTIETSAFAQVVAPWHGTVRFAGPLADLGLVLILEPENGSLLILAGLGRLDRTIGESVVRGHRLGDMGGALPPLEEFLLEASADHDQIPRKALYLELRHGGRAIAPGPWLDPADEGTRE